MSLDAEGGAGDEQADLLNALHMDGLLQGDEEEDVGLRVRYGMTIDQLADVGQDDGGRDGDFQASFRRATIARLSAGIDKNADGVFAASQREQTKGTFALRRHALDDGDGAGVLALQVKGGRPRRRRSVPGRRRG